MGQKRLLTKQQIKSLAGYVREDHGPDLSKEMLNSRIAETLEDVAGFETLDEEQMADYIQQIAIEYYVGEANGTTESS